MGPENFLKLALIISKIVPVSYNNTFKSVRFKYMQHIFSFYNNSQSCKKKKRKKKAIERLGLNHTFY